MRAQFWLVLLLATSAHADTSGGSSVKITIVLSDPARPIQPRGSTVGPEIGAEHVLSVDGLKGTIRAEQEQILVDLIAQTADREVDEKSNYYFMLGELQAKQHRHWRLRSAELTLEADQTKNTKTRAEATAAAEKAKQYLAKAVKTFKGLVDNEAFRNYPKMDVALFYFGYTLQGAQQMAEARAVYHKLIKNHPQSKYVPEAYLAFADHFFDTGDAASAETYYKMILKFPRSTVYWYAMYRMGWIHLHLQRFQEALETFFQVVQATRSDQRQEGLNRASAKDFVYAYAEIGKADKARAAFLRVDGKRAVEMLQLLADVYLESGKADKAIWIYQELTKTEPGNQNACLWRYNIARATAYNAGTAQELEICAADIEPLKAWARASGATVSCARCAGTKRP